MIDGPDIRGARHVTDDQEILRQKRRLEARSKEPEERRRYEVEDTILGKGRLVSIVSLPCAFLRGTESSRRTCIFSLALTSAHAFHGVFLFSLCPSNTCNVPEARQGSYPLSFLRSHTRTRAFLMQNVYSKNQTAETITTKLLRPCLEHIYSCPICVNLGSRSLSGQETVLVPLNKA